MKLLIYSHFFAPSIGGVENIVLSLARGLAELRDSNGVSQFEVTLFTETQAGNNDDAALPFRVVRRAGLIQLWQLIRSSDVVHVAGPALAPLFLSFIARKPLVIEHHGYQAICPNGVMVYQPDRTELSPLPEVPNQCHSQPCEPAAHVSAPLAFLQGRDKHCHCTSRP